MKQYFYFLATSTFMFAFWGLNGQTMTFSPEKAKPGDKITLKYNPAGSELEGAEAVEITAYLIEDGKLVAQDVDLAATDGVLAGSVTTTAKTAATLFSVKSADGELTDGNDNKGYKVLSVTPDGEPVQGALAAKARIYASFYRYAGIDANREKAFNLLKREFEVYPESKSNPKNFNLYAYLAKRTKDEEAIAAAKQEMLAIANNKSASEEDLNLAMGLANVFENEELSASLKETIMEKYPDGEMAQREERNGFRGKKELEEQLAFVESYNKRFGDSESIESDLNYFYSSIASNYAKQEDWENFDKYSSMISSPASKAGVLNNVAWTLSGESLEADAPHLEKGLAMSKKSLQLLSAEMDSPGDEKPASFSAKQWAKNLKGSYGMYADTYALLAYKTGDHEGALEHQQIACDQNKFSNGEMTERYTVYFEKVNGAAKTEKLLAKFIAEGNATSNMKARHKELFLENNTIESAYDKYLVQLEKAAKEKLREEIKEKMIEEDAPGFDLVNLDGEQVSLESLKGKVVVIDFWATWCGPCKASFPGMQKAVNKYKDANDVAFVFIDTWERGDEKEKNAAEFIESKGYTFNVLMDNENAVVAAFGVSGIPTKFVVDKSGKIRFKSVGFNGNDDELVTELSMMIEMAGGSVPGMTGAP